VNVGSAGTRPLGTGLPAVEVVSAWRGGVVLGAWESHVHGLVTSQAIGKAPSSLSRIIFLVAQANFLC
jgi:hypothetical protein